MGLKWFRARLSMEKEASKIPKMTGLYRRVLYFEPDVSMTQTNKTSAVQSSSITDSISTNNEGVQYNQSRADLTSQSSSLPIINSEKHNNRVTENIESSTSSKDTNIKEQLVPNEQLNKTNKNQNDSPDMKSAIYSDNEIVI